MKSRFTLNTLVALVVLTFAASSCSFFQKVDPFGPAKTFEQTAFASISVGHLYLKLATDIVDGKGAELDKDLLRGLALSVESVYTAMTAANQGLRTYTIVRDAPDSTPEKIDAALKAASLSIDALAPAIRNLANAIDSVKGAPK